MGSIEHCISQLFGLGVRPPIPESGGTCDQGWDYLGVAPWLSAIPEHAMALAIVSTNPVGDGLHTPLGPHVESWRGGRDPRSPLLGV
jgi:ABC-type dipeptide/oligopeptide/nickel transport system permease subunit